MLLELEPIAASERVVAVKNTDSRHRHTIVQQRFAHLAPGASLQLVVDHDPRPLWFQLEAKHGAHCHPTEMFDAMKRRIPFSKEDRGLYRDWLAVAAVRDATLTAERPLLIAAE